MAMAVGGTQGGVTSEPNVIPMIDILLVLLIIFMITLPLSRTITPVNVPPPVQNASNAPSTQIVLNIAEDGSYSINGQPVPQGQLGTQIHAIFDNRPAKLLFIKAAGSRKYQDVIDAMDIARGSGIEVIGFTPKT